MIGEPCQSCGGEIVHRLRAATTGILSRCAGCGASCHEPVALPAGAGVLFAETARSRRDLRASLRPVRPLVLLWLPAAEPADRDEAVMLRDRLAEDDPSVMVVEEPYPEVVDAPAALLAGLADICLLHAPGKSVGSAIRLLDRAIPASRALVFTDTADVRHRRVVSVRRGGLFDEVAGVLAHVRRVAFLCALDTGLDPGDLLRPDHETECLAMAAEDDAAALVLALLSRPGERRLVGPLVARIPLLEAAGLIRMDGEEPCLTGRGRAFAALAVPAPGVSRDENESALARMFREARAGDQEALGRLLQTGGDEAHRIARRRLGSRLRRKIDSIDISQSVVGDLLQHLDRFEFRGEPEWRGYLRKLVENKIRAKADYYGAARRDSSRESAMPTEAPDAPTPTPSEELLKKEEYEHLESSLSRLPEAEREVLVLRIFKGMSHREIADALGRPSENAVHKLYGRALARLAGIMRRD